MWFLSFELFYGMNPIKCTQILMEGNVNIQETKLLSLSNLSWWI